MVQYTLAQSPEVILTVSGKDSPKAREEAMDKLVELMDEGQLPTQLLEGFSPQELIEVKEPEVDETSDDPVVEAVQILSSLANLKLKAERAREQALQIRAQIDILFTDQPTSEEEIANLKDAFKVLKAFALADRAYRQARAKAEEARALLDKALQSPDK